MRGVEDRSREGHGLTHVEGVEIVRMLSRDVSDARTDHWDGQVVAELGPSRLRAVSVGQHARVEVGEPAGERVVVETGPALDADALGPRGQQIDGCRGLLVAYPLVHPHDGLDARSLSAQVGNGPHERGGGSDAVDVGAEVAQVNAYTGGVVGRSGRTRIVSEEGRMRDHGRGAVRDRVHLGPGGVGEGDELVRCGGEHGERSAVLVLRAQLGVLQIVHRVDQWPTEAAQGRDRVLEFRGAVRLDPEMHVDQVEIFDVRLEPRRQQDLRGPPLAGRSSRRRRVGQHANVVRIRDGGDVGMGRGNGGDSNGGDDDLLSSS